jgi:hypothetical protein
MSRLPQVMLWAWERREDLSFIHPREAGVAYLALTLRLSGDRVVIRPRRQPLIVPPDAVVIPVARIETDWHSAAPSVSWLSLLDAWYETPPRRWARSGRFCLT